MRGRYPRSGERSMIGAVDAPKTTLQLFGRQCEALDSYLDDLLIGGPDRPCGTSHLLRVAGIVLAASTPGLQVFLGKQNAADLRRNHVEGPTGIVATVADMQRHAACVVTPSEVRFPEGGVLRWGGLSRDADVRRTLERRIGVLLLDDVDEVPELMYRRLRDHTLHGVGPLRRSIAASNRLGSAGWVDRHWNSLEVPGRGFLRFSPTDIDEGMVQKPPVMGYREFIDSIQPGWLWPPHVELVVDSVERWIRGDWEHLAVFMPAQHSKCLATETPILTTNGWSTMGDLKIGDEVFDECGWPTKVTGKGAVKKEQRV